MQEESAKEDDEEEEWSLVIELYIFFSSCTPAAGLHKINLVVSQACVQ